MRWLMPGMRTDPRRTGLRTTMTHRVSRRHGWDGCHPWPRAVDDPGKLGVVRRPFLIVLLLISLAFQGLAVAAQRMVTEPGDHEHAVLHLQEVAHHHHDDGAIADEASVVVDNSAESASHVASDGALTAFAMPSVLASVAPAPSANSPPQWQSTFPSSPDLEGLRRPPRSTL